MLTRTHLTCITRSLLWIDFLTYCDLNIAFPYLHGSMLDLGPQGHVCSVSSKMAITSIFPSLLHLPSLFSLMVPFTEHPASIFKHWAAWFKDLILFAYLFKPLVPISRLGKSSEIKLQGNSFVLVPFFPTSLVWFLINAS